jgi:hypothetical protein
MDNPAQMNVWLRKTVPRELAEDGGKVPAELLDDGGKRVREERGLCFGLSASSGGAKSR